MRPTGKDVARRAGVSPKTVSNVLTGTAGVSARTRTKVEQAMKELSYVPNHSARSLRNGRSGLIGLALPDLSTPYSAELAHHIVDVAHERGYGVQIEETGQDPLREFELMSQARTNIIDGLILNPIFLEKSAVQVGVALPPVVLLGEVSQQLADRVWVDGVSAARDMTLLLAARGHRRIAVLGAEHQRYVATAHTRTEGYRLALGELNIPHDPSLEIPCDVWSPRGSAEVMRSYLETHELPDAIFCFTDSMAIGALSVLSALGYRVPDDVAVAGFDDIADGEFANPPLTTVSFNRREMAERTIEMLIRRMADRHREPETTTVGYRIIERASTLGAQRPARPGQ
ncbi:LacI family DNA-binding transcriptional regulator [Arthrobacter sp. H5]|uniref:LacI family DNA-binding transcriptional regulator n=1 Tax=Arthrobacter sp. H5 TaxID=1267973 RepID=UPI000488AABE|nr:LacI family DNA-binding transcriptional regulator [Arthrobacter sp. H5]